MIPARKGGDFNFDRNLSPGQKTFCNIFRLVLIVEFIPIALSL